MEEVGNDGSVDSLISDATDKVKYSGFIGPDPTHKICIAFQGLLSVFRLAPNGFEVCKDKRWNSLLGREN